MIIGNLNNLKDLNRATKNVHTIFHFAATADLNEANDKPFETVENNIMGTVKLIKASLKNNVKKIIFASCWSVWEKFLVCNCFHKQNSRFKPFSIGIVCKFAF